MCVYVHGCVCVCVCILVCVCERDIKRMMNILTLCSASVHEMNLEQSGEK